MIIRKANITDSRRISYLIRKNTQKVIENQYSDDQIRIWKAENTPNQIEKKIEKSTVFCAFENNKLVGTIGLKGHEIFGMYVSYSMRHRGIGSKLLSHLENYARANSVKELQLTSTISAFEFYRGNGYQDHGPVVVTIKGIDFNEIKMIKKLSN